jgi:hypothetical protein
VPIKPIFARFDHAIDAWQWGLNPTDFDKVNQGYACGRCLEDFGGIHLLKCPVCGEEQNLVMDAPPEWGPRR